MNQPKRSKEPTKSGRGNGDWHGSRSSMGMGDYYGTGVRQKIGKMREGVGMETLSKKQLGTKPKSVV